ncbi:hypothetical protein M3Y99_00234700 [Aphelenchoides fujianensis]|nr:hypothetical protein M3Y99_00234700 [Aphelenchoides fujianensis]
MFRCSPQLTKFARWPAAVHAPRRLLATPPQQTPAGDINPESTASQQQTPAGSIKQGDGAIPRHTTKKEFEGMHDALRSRERGADENTGLRPSGIQRRMLVLTGLYKSAADVPEFVPGPTMRRLSDRIRAMFVIAIALGASSMFVMYDMRARRIPQQIAQDNAIVFDAQLNTPVENSDTLGPIPGAFIRVRPE